MTIRSNPKGYEGGALHCVGGVTSRTMAPLAGEETCVTIGTEDHTLQ